MKNENKFLARGISKEGIFVYGFPFYDYASKIWFLLKPNNSFIRGKLEIHKMEIKKAPNKFIENCFELELFENDIVNFARVDKKGNKKYLTKNIEIDEAETFYNQSDFNNPFDKTKLYMEIIGNIYNISS